MKPLEGVKVLELARILAGPWIGQLLADLGADVVKVERAGAGDDTRGWGPPFLEGTGGENLSAAYFHSTNRGKRSVEADFETEDGRALVRKLARHADVVVENFKVGGLATYGLDAASLRAAHPRLVYCSGTGFGQTRPHAPLARASSPARARAPPGPAPARPPRIPASFSREWPGTGTAPATGAPRR